MVKKVKNKVSIKDSTNQEHLDVFTVEDTEGNPLVTLNFNSGLCEEDLLTILIARVAQRLEAGEVDVCMNMLNNSLRNAHAALILREALTEAGPTVQPTE